MVQLSLRIKDVAEEKGIDNSHALSLKAGLTHHQVKALWDNTFTNVNFRALARLSEVLEVDPRDLITVDKKTS